MATDARGHYVPAASDHPSRDAWVLKVALSIKDPIPVTNTTTRAALITTLGALSPAITASTSNPIFVFRADAPAGRQVEFTVDGTNWEGDSAWTQTPITLGSGVTNYVTAPYAGLYVRRVNGVVWVVGAVTKASWTNGDTVATLATGWRPATTPIPFRSSTGMDLVLATTGIISVTANAGGTAFAVSTSFPAG
jgi:hypothetical protein